MSTIPLSTSSTTPGARLLSDESTSDSFDPEIMVYFISRGFQSNLIRSFLEGEVHLDLKTNTELMFDFLEERRRLNPKIYVGIEGTGISGVTSGDDKRLLVEWGLTEEASNELRNSVCDDILWSKKILYHWLFEWVLNPWDSNIQMAFDKIFYDAQFPHNQWNSYDRKGGPQMFASSYDDIATGIDKILSSNTKVADANSTNTTQHAFFYATNYQSVQAISKNGIKLKYGKSNLDFGRDPSFYLNSSINNAINWIKNRKGFNGIVVYWVEIDRIKSMNYRDLVSEGDDLWKRVVVASRCAQESEVDDDDFVYGYQLSNPKQILTEWKDHGGEDVEGSWQNVIPNAQWFEPIQHLQLALKTPRAVKLMNSYLEEEAAKNYTLLAITLAVKEYAMKELGLGTSVSELKCQEVANIKYKIHRPMENILIGNSNLTSDISQCVFYLIEKGYKVESYRVIYQSSKGIVFAYPK
ncbi:hypothetical protein C1645_816813 [Glomus cerebriforme]|uniref:Uncharacterized protein n=1 Tax=Glomus cerebriforme TaxID=658196 RepID=A0A397TJY6_9GLOM|nr:hypothetical protein C1645_816813 [Glomus cerebriforme]